MKRLAIILIFAMAAAAAAAQTQTPQYLPRSGGTLTGAIDFISCAVKQSTMLHLWGSVSRYPECYGAVGDGVTDDEPAFAAAMAACPSGYCSIKLSAKNYLFKEQWTVTGAGISVIGDGYGATRITVSPASAITAGIQASNTPLFKIEGINLTCNSNVTYCLEHTSTASAEAQTVSNLHIQGGQYNWAISPVSHNDISHVNGWGLVLIGAGTASTVVGDGVQSNVLVNSCTNCSMDTSAGDGLLIRGGGMNWLGGAVDENGGVDFQITGPPDQVVNIVGVRSEGSKQFFQLSSGSSGGIPTINLIGDQWFSSSSPNTCNPIGITAGPCAITVEAATNINIIGGRYSSSVGDVEMDFGGPSTTAVVSVVMQNVATSNPNFGASLQAIANRSSVVLSSVNDQYVDNSFTKHLGSGHTYSAQQSPVIVSSQHTEDQFGNVSYGGTVKSALTVSDPAGGFGQYTNLLLDSDFNSGSLGSVWTDYCGLTSGTFTANTTDITDPNGTNTAVKYVQGTTNPGCGGGSGGVVQQTLATLTAGSTYSICGWINGNGASVPFVQWGFDVTGVYAGSSTSYLLPADTNWHFLGPFQYTIPASGWPGSHSGANVGVFGVGGTTIYLWHWQIAKGSSCGVYARTGSAAIAPTLGYLDQNGDPVGTLRGTLTYTAATSDSATIAGVAASSQCTFTPTNSTAAATTVLGYISSISAGTVTITHAATSASGGTVSILCTKN